MLPTTTFQGKEEFIYSKWQDLSFNEEALNEILKESIVEVNIGMKVYSSSTGVLKFLTQRDTYRYYNFFDRNQNFYEQIENLEEFS